METRNRAGVINNEQRVIFFIIQRVYGEKHVHVDGFGHWKSLEILEQGAD